MPTKQGLSNKSIFNNFIPARSVSDGDDFRFWGLVRQTPRRPIKHKEESLPNNC